MGIASRVLMCAGIVAVVAATGLANTIAYYRFENGPNNGSLVPPLPGAVTDSGPNALNATAGLRSPFLTYTSNTPVAGSNFALNATGDGGWAQASNSLFNQTGSWTLETYANPSSPYSGSNAGLDVIVAKKDAEVGGNITSYGLAWTGSAFAGFIHAAAFGSPIFLGTGVVTEGVWHHLALVFKENGTSDVLSLYMDHVLQSSFTGDLSIVYSSLPFLIGAANFQNDPNGAFRRNFGGLIDEVRLSDEALAPSQMLATPGGNLNATAAPLPSTALAGGALLLLVRTIGRARPHAKPVLAARC